MARNSHSESLFVSHQSLQSLSFPHFRHTIIRDPFIQRQEVKMSLFLRGSRLSFLNSVARSQIHTRALSTRRWFGAAPSSFLDREEVQQRAMTVLKNFPKVDEMKVSASAHFANDLGLDSLDQVEVVMAFEDEFGVEIPDDEAEKILSTDDAIRYISAHPQAK